MKGGGREAALRRFHEEEQIERAHDARMLWRLWAFVRPHAGYLWGWLGLLVFQSLLGLARPLVMRQALDGLAAPGGTARLHQLGLLLAGLIVLEQAVSFPQSYWLQLVGARAMAALRRRLFAFLHGLPLAFFDRTPIGRLVTRVTNDVDAIGEIFASGALNAIGDLLTLVVIASIMLALDWRLSLVAFAVLPPVALGVDFTRRAIRVAWREVRAKTARLNAFLNEQVTGVTVVQAYAHEVESEREFAVVNAGYRAASMRALIYEATLDAAMEMVSSVCVAAILWYAGFRSLWPSVSFGTLFAFVVYIDLFFGPVRNLSARYTLLQSAMAGAERVFELLDVPDRDEAAPTNAEQSEPAAAGAPGTPERPDAPGASPGAALELEHVTFGYRPDTPVLHDVSLTVRTGETVALVGATGSGKTTIASLLLRLYPVRQGVVRVLGRDVRELERTELRRAFAVVPQEVFLFPGTIASNVGATEREPDRDRVRQTLEAVGALDLIERRPGGIDAPVLERGANLSAGERQLVAFARALYRDPPILVLDEPTASIDSDTEARVQRAVATLTAGRTVLLIAHRLSTVRSADRLVCLHHGRVVEEGTHAQLLAAGGLYARLHRLHDTRAAIESRAAAVTAVGSR